jgi:hypothetical protein
MGLLTEREGLTFVSIFDGKFEVRVKPGTEGAVIRTKKDGEDIHVVNYGGISGKIVDIQKDVTEWQGKKMSSLKIFLQDADQKYCLNWSYNSGLTTAFYHMIENVDLSKPVTFTASKKKDSKGNERVSLFMAQDGQNLKWKYTKDYAYGPGEVQKPAWEKKTIKGEEVWDNTAEILFFEKILKDKILPVLRKPSVVPEPDEDNFDDVPFPGDGDAPPVESGEALSDDLPF